MGMFDFLLGKQEDKEPFKGETLDGQPLLNLSKAKSRRIDESRFIFLGSYGKKDKKTYQKVKKAIQEMGYTDDVILLRNNSELIKFGVMNTPALVVDGKVVTYGKHLEEDEVKELFEKYKL